MLASCTKFLLCTWRWWERACMTLFSVLFFFFFWGGFWGFFAPFEVGQTCGVYWLKSNAPCVGFSYTVCIVVAHAHTCAHTHACARRDTFPSAQPLAFSILMFLHAVTPVESISGTCLGVLMILYSSTLELKLNGDCIVSKMLTISLILKRIKVYVLVPY